MAQKKCQCARLEEIEYSLLIRSWADNTFKHHQGAVKLQHDWVECWHKYQGNYSLDALASAGTQLAGRLREVREL